MCTLLLLALLAADTPGDPNGDGTAASPAPPLIGVSLASSSAVVEPAAAIGPGVWLRRPIAGLPLAFGARLGLGWSSSTNGLWDFTNYQGEAALGVGLEGS